MNYYQQPMQMQPMQMQPMQYRQPMQLIQYQQQPMPMQIQPVMMQPVMQPIMMQQAPATRVVVVQQTTIQIPLDACSILCGCRAPRMRICQCWMGFQTCCGTGSGLECGTCCGCYGCNRSDCCSVWCGGWLQQFTLILIVGYISGCVVGCKMMGCCGGVDDQKTYVGGQNNWQPGIDNGFTVDVQPDFQPDFQQQDVQQDVQQDFQQAQDYGNGEQ